MTELIVFDLDGTLIDSMQDIAGAVNRMRESFGLAPLPFETVKDMTGDGARSLVTRALQGTGISVDEGAKRQREFYTAHPVDTTTLYPGVSEGLAQMKEKGIRLAVVTNKQTHLAEMILKNFGVDRFFDVIWGGDSGFPLKPDPTALLAFQKQCGAAAENCWMLGDHYTDLGAGRQAGFRRALARWGFGDPGEESFDREFDSFAEFTQAVTQA